MDKKSLKILENKYKSSCLNCERVKEFNEDTVLACGGCKKFSKQEMALLLHEYYVARQRVSSGATLGLPDEILVRIFELYLSGTTKYSIVKMINSEFKRKGKKKTWVNWKQVHYVITEKYISDDAHTRIARARAKAENNLSNQGVEVSPIKDESEEE